jgi:NADH-quinone oxidoreductase subunit A
MDQLVGYLLLFLVVGIGFVLVHLLIGKLVRPARMDAEKATIYECGEPTVGSAWVQFDVRYYVVALLFVIFDVEVAFFFPWAIVFGQTNAVAQVAADKPEPDSVQLTMAKKELLYDYDNKQPQETPIRPEQASAAKQFALLAFVDILVFFGVLLVGFAYLWRRGDLSWVRSTAAERAAEAAEVETPVESRARSLVGV